jgi:putative addiction module component (TIGR02574 family)
MNKDVRRLLDAALRLPPEARAALAGSLLDSIDENVDEDAELAWAAEIAKRLGDLDSGRVRPVPWSEARRTIAGR